MAKFNKGDKVVVSKVWPVGDFCYKLGGMTGEVKSDQEGASVWVTLDEPKKWFSEVWSDKQTDVLMDPEWLSIRDTIQADVLSYLTAGGSVAERKLAMQDLTLLNFFHTGSVQEARDTLEQYLSSNNRRFCAEGIKRFRTAVKLPEALPKKSPLHPDALVLADLKYGDMFRRYHENQPSDLYVYLGEQREQTLSVGGTHPQIKVVRVNRTVDAWNPGEPEWIYTGDAGLTPYSGRAWNRSNHCRREGIEQPRKVVSSSRRRGTYYGI